ncbi:DUF6548 family protein [Pseudobutyrivibrio sp.]|uniref:DUF6548 family protein n=1 Tax=Pseudobutyrivibrio sp. TaxID=2014367 RepID=UPI001D7DFAF3|nr:DUF6548 family protein [Pseudobutyrivibrio sp.]MBE5909858.1 hypothetical protein [Pseudobutyrivibrio sp.]
MGTSNTRKINERFYDEYNYFDKVLCERLNIEEHGVSGYLAKMKEAVIEAREVIPEWDVTRNRLTNIQKRHADLKQNDEYFEDFQGKDEDVVWMQVFCEKLEANADPLSKYSTMKFSYKTRKKSLWQRIVELFN